VTPEDVAAELDVLASRVCRMSPPLARNLERFHEERSDIAKDLADLARRVSPRNGPASGVAVDVSDIRSGRIICNILEYAIGQRASCQEGPALARYFE